MQVHEHLAKRQNPALSSEPIDFDTERLTRVIRRFQPVPNYIRISYATPLSDIGFDSYGLVDLTVALEETFRVTLPCDLICDAETVSDLARAVALSRSQFNRTGTRMIGGSQQLRTFRRARRDGASLEDAAKSAGMSLGEAKLWDAEDAKNPPPPEAYVLLPTFPASSSSRPTQAQSTEAIMARGKPEEATNGPIRPDFDKMKQLFGKIQTAEEKNATARGDLSGYWSSIEDDCHAHKGAAKTLRKLHGMSEENRTDYLRTLLGGLEAFDMMPKLDLVDQMEAHTAGGLGDDGIDD